MESGNQFRLIDVLTKHNVPFVIIGGCAVIHHGYVRATEDIDIVIRRSPDGEESLLASLVEINARWIGDEIDPATGIERTFPVTMSYIRASRIMLLVTDFGFLDIFDFIPGHPAEDVQQLFDSAIDNRDRRFASLAWLRRMKVAAGRTQDLLDLENLPSA